MNIKEFVQELLANTVEHMVETYELPGANMSIDQGAELVRIGDRLGELLTEFVEDNKWNDLYLCQVMKLT